MNTKRKENSDGCFCPIPDPDGGYSACSDRCMWYVEENNDYYSGCAIPKILVSLNSLYFSGIRGANVNR